MIDQRVADAVNVDDVIVIPWPDWPLRRMVVVSRKRLREGVIAFDVRPREGDDLGIVQHIARAVNEPIQVIVKLTEGGNCKRCGTALPSTVGRGGRKPEFCTESCRKLWRRSVA